LPGASPCAPPFDLDQGKTQKRNGEVLYLCSKESPMLAPNPQSDVFTIRTEDVRPNSDAFERFIFAVVLVVGYAVAVAALLYPVAMYVFW
jgi:hypothetical protein